NYNRIRIGINHPGDKSLVTNYVLNNFTKDEKDLMNKKINKMMQNFELILENIPLFLTRINEEN
ncbi:aminoacyl-tRNA hydrolase, partial [Pelagibacteraceae bacterium]|nr:aminoacyl-tRNA hydrolase [Pelagibacteraceae bacterium]